MIDTFSSNSLKILDRSLKEFEDKYIYNLSLFKKDERAILGQNFHALICMYLKSFDVSKLLLALKPNEQMIWHNLEEKLSKIKNNFIELEFPFLIKCNLLDKFYYLTGRFDAIYKENDQYIVWDWKTLNFPSNPEDDLQSIVYLYCVNQIYNTEKITMRYFSIEKLNYYDVKFDNLEKYKIRIDEIIKKLPHYNVSNSDFES